MKTRFQRLRQYFPRILTGLLAVCFAFTFGLWRSSRRDASYYQAGVEWYEKAISSNLTTYISGLESQLTYYMEEGSAENLSNALEYLVRIQTLYWVTEYYPFTTEYLPRFERLLRETPERFSEQAGEYIDCFHTLSQDPFDMTPVMGLQALLDA